MKQIIPLILAFTVLSSCSDSNYETVQVGENTFVHEEKVYRIIDNELTELGDLDSDSISKSTVLNPSLKDYGNRELDYIKPGASSNLTAVYRGDILYYKMELEGLNDLRDSYTGGLSINFVDDFGFQIHSTDIVLNELIRIVGNNDETLSFQYDGKTQMSSEVYRAIANYSVSSSLRKKGQFNW